eukprot:117327-Rhodomonas_salina.1
MSDLPVWSRPSACQYRTACEISQRAVQRLLLSNGFCYLVAARQSTLLLLCLSEPAASVPPRAHTQHDVSLTTARHVSYDALHLGTAHRVARA